MAICKAGTRLRRQRSSVTSKCTCGDEATMYLQRVGFLLRQFVMTLPSLTLQLSQDACCLATPDLCARTANCCHACMSHVFYNTCLVLDALLHSNRFTVQQILPALVCENWALKTAKPKSCRLKRSISAAPAQHQLIVLQVCADAYSDLKPFTTKWLDAI